MIAELLREQYREQIHAQAGGWDLVGVIHRIINCHCIPHCCSTIPNLLTFYKRFSVRCYLYE